MNTTADQDDSNNTPAKKTPRKLYHWTVCMVPPENSERVWSKLTECRTELRDPGLFRWPPHTNLLYPFLDCYQHQSSKETDDNEPAALDPEIIKGLVGACRQCEPFTV